MTAQYILVVEQFPDENTTTEFRMEGNGENVPNAVVIHEEAHSFSGYVFVLVGKYAEKGDRFAFKYVEIEEAKPLATHTIGRYDADRWVAE